MGGIISKSLKLFERMIVICLVVMMMAVILLSTIELGHILVLRVSSPPAFLIEINDVLEIFGYFMLILIGVELLETIRAYLNDHVVHVEIVLEVALIALARKVVILDLKEYPPATMAAVALLVLALAGAFYLQKVVHPKRSG